MSPASTYRLSGVWTKALRHICQRRSVILGYHGVACCARKDDAFMLQLAPDRFRAQLELMVAAGFRFVTVARLARQASGSALPGLAAVSFDDGMRNNLTTAMPILSDLEIPATVYIPTGWIGGHSPWIGSASDDAILSEDDVRELAQAGWELGAHTVSHADLSLLDYDGCRSEIDGSCEALARIAGVTVETLAYPFGRYGSAAIAATRDAGLVAAVTTGSGRWESYELTRAMIGAADPFPILLLKMTDRYEPLLRFAPLSHARRMSRQLRHRISDRAGDRSGP